MFVVAGVTGNVGGVTAATLLEMGKPVRVIVRNEAKGEPWKARGAEVAVADLLDATAVAAALAGAEAAFLMVPPTSSAPDLRADRKQVSMALSEATLAAAVPHLVLLSSVGAHLDSGTGVVIALHDMEAAFADFPGTRTLLRPCSFLENWTEPIKLAQAQGILPSYLTLDHRIPMISTLDIGRTAAACLLEPMGRRKVIEMAGPEDHTPIEVAEALAALLATPVTAVPMSMEAVVPMFMQFGATENAAQLLAELAQAINTETIPYEGGEIEFRRGSVTLKEGLAHILSLE